MHYSILPKIVFIILKLLPIFKFNQLNELYLWTNNNFNNGSLFNFENLDHKILALVNRLNGKIKTVMCELVIACVEKYYLMNF